MPETPKSSWKSSIKQGEYRRKASQFRDWISADGSSGFIAEPERYHLYVSLACPWAHRTLIFRELKQLKELIGVSVVHPDMYEKGWSFEHNAQLARAFGTTGDTLYGHEYLSQLYLQSNPKYRSTISVPVLWDKQKNCIVNNESSEIIRMFNSAFDHLTGNRQDYYPVSLRAEIDDINTLVYSAINNGVYKTGFATTQAAYEKHCRVLFDALDTLEQRLSKQRYLVGSQLSEADWRLFTTLVRFDAVYHTHFKCNIRQMSDYPSLFAYMRDLYQQPGIAPTVHLAHIKRHYYASHRSINPYGIVPLGPEQDWNAPHHREKLS